MLDLDGQELYRRRTPMAPTAPRRPTQPIHPTQPMQSMQAMHPTHAAQPTLAKPARMPVLPTTAALSATAALPITPALPATPALMLTPALATVAALPTTPVDAVLPALPTTAGPIANSPTVSFPTTANSACLRSSPSNPFNRFLAIFVSSDGKFINPRLRVMRLLELKSGILRFVQTPYFLPNHFLFQIGIDDESNRAVNRRNRMPPAAGRGRAGKEMLEIRRDLFQNTLVISGVQAGEIILRLTPHYEVIKQKSDAGAAAKPKPAIIFVARLINYLSSITHL